MTRGVLRSLIMIVGSISGLDRIVTAGLGYGASREPANFRSKMLSYLMPPWDVRSNWR